MGLLAGLVTATFGIAAAVLAASAARATDLVVIRGDDAPVALSVEDLSRMPQVTIVTGNEFIDGETAYRGPLMRDVMAALDLEQAETLRFTAANDYFIDIPASDFRDYDVILAMEADGVRLTRRDKGPLWLMYPISDNPELRDPVFVHRLIWQVVRIETK